MHRQTETEMEGRKLNLNTVPPAPPEPAKVEQPTSEPVIETPNVQGQPTQVPTTPPVTESPQAEPPKVDAFFEEFNKRYGTQYKTDDEVKPIFGLPKKVTEYEGKHREFEKSIADYQRKITELEEAQDPLKYFSNPESYIAEQLKMKYPKSNPDTLQEIVRTDVSKMNDLDVLIKSKQLFVPNAPKESVLRSVILSQYGIDPNADPEEWDDIAKARMQLDAASERDKIEAMKGVIEMPKVLTKEEKELARKLASESRATAIAPLKETFNKYDKFTYKDIEGFEFDVPEDYRKALPDMFQSMFIDAGLEPTQENLNTALELRDALFVHQYLPKLREIWLKEGETRAKAGLDKELHNDIPPNTKTASDDKNTKVLQGLSKFVSDYVKR